MNNLWDEDCDKSYDEVKDEFVMATTFADLNYLKNKYRDSFSSFSRFLQKDLLEEYNEEFNIKDNNAEI